MTQIYIHGSTISTFSLKSKCKLTIVTRTHGGTCCRYLLISSGKVRIWNVMLKRSRINNTSSGALRSRSEMYSADEYSRFRNCFMNNGDTESGSPECYIQTTIQNWLCYIILPSIYPFSVVCPGLRLFVCKKCSSAKLLMSSLNCIAAGKMQL